MLAGDIGDRFVCSRARVWIDRRLRCVSAFFGLTYWNSDDPVSTFANHTVAFTLQMRAGCHVVVAF